MSYIEQDIIDEVIRRADLVRVVERYVQLKRSGSSFKGLCPFHSEKTPSFSVKPSIGRFKCFGCGENGDVVGFLMKIEGWTFPEAVRKLADEVGVEIPEGNAKEDAAAKKKRAERELYFAITAASADFFQNNLLSPSGRAAQFYLKERRVNADVAKAFKLGYAPDGWSNLLDFLTKKGFKPKQIERTGLIIPRQNDGFYDRFRDRIIFPVLDIWNHPLAFGGRRLNNDPNNPKYINSPETDFYTKGEQLYGLHVNKSNIQKKDFAILVEGNFDVISLFTYGFDVAVAPMGTALTDDQARLLARYTREVIVAFDGDSAGLAAAKKAIAPLAKANINSRVIQFDPNDDPDTFLASHGTDAFQHLIDNAENLVTWAIRQVLPVTERVDYQTSMQALDDATEILRNLGTPSELSFEIRLISESLSLSIDTIQNYLRGHNHTKETIENSFKLRSEINTFDPAEYGILYVILRNPGMLNGFAKEEYHYLFDSDVIRSLIKELADFYDNQKQHGQDFDLKRFLPSIKDNPTKMALVEQASMDPKPRYREGNDVKYFRDCLRAIKINWAGRALEMLRSELHDIDPNTDEEHWNEVARKIQALQKFRFELNKT